MKTIEELFAENRATTDQTDLPMGHRERMQARLNSAAAPVTQPAKRRTIHRIIGASVAAAAAIIAVCMLLIPTTPQEPAQPLTAEQIEAIEVEQYYKMERNRAIDEVQAMLSKKNSVVASQISYDLDQLKLNFEADPLPRSLFNHNPEKYIALTVARYTAQKEVVDQLKHSITNI